MGEYARPYAKVLASTRLDSGQFKSPRNRKAGSSFGFTGASEPPGPRAPLASCLSSGTRYPANTSPLNQELLTLALESPDRWVRARTADSRSAALCLSRRPGRARLGPGLLGQFYVIAHRACERRCK